MGPVIIQDGGAYKAPANEELLGVSVTVPDLHRLSQINQLLDMCYLFATKWQSIIGNNTINFLNFHILIQERFCEHPVGRRLKPGYGVLIGAATIKDGGAYKAPETEACLEVVCVIDSNSFALCTFTPFQEEFIQLPNGFKSRLYCLV
ncbi:hypothetical protein J6590_098223 [Homalodisca vitripennis]|nr:hypothetical protein J6590_098223 [Homalodisca vitripennis]